jgi:transposase-like protein
MKRRLGDLRLFEQRKSDGLSAISGGLAFDPDLFLTEASNDSHETESRSLPPAGDDRVLWLRRRNLGLIRGISGADYAIGKCFAGEFRPSVLKRLRRTFTDEDEGKLCQSLGLERGWFDEPHQGSDIPAHVVEYCLTFNVVWMRGVNGREARKTKEEEKVRKTHIESIRRISTALFRATKRRRRAVKQYGERVPGLRTRRPKKPLVEKRERFSMDEKRRIVKESFEPGKAMLSVARANDVSPMQLTIWRKLYQNGQLSSVTEGAPVVPAFELAYALRQIVKLQKMLEYKERDVMRLRKAVSNLSEKPRAS